MTRSEPNVSTPDSRALDAWKEWRDMERMQAHPDLIASARREFEEILSQLDATSTVDGDDNSMTLFHADGTPYMHIADYMQRGQ